MSMSIYDLTAYEVIRDKELSDLKSRGRGESAADGE